MSAVAARKSAWYQANRSRELARSRSWYLAHRKQAITAATIAVRERRKWINEIKLQRGCEFVLDDGSVCGWRDHPAALDFDHRDPAFKDFGISARATSAKGLLLAEMAKCDVLCANHHRIRTAMEGHIAMGRRPKTAVALTDSQLSLFEEAS